MKKTLSLALVCLLAVLLIIPVSAANWAGVTLVNEFDNPPAWYDDAEIVTLHDFWVEDETNARAGIDYVYLKNDEKGDFSVQFDVAESGYYNIGVTLMGWAKSVLRSTNIKVDDSDWVYLSYDYEDDDQYTEHFFSGMLIELAKGTHTFTLSLASDFDDSTVKSLYFYNMFFAKTNIQDSETDAPAVVQPEDPAPETPAETTTTADAAESAPESAPQTFDFGICAIAVAAVSLIGCAVSKKK